MTEWINIIPTVDKMDVITGTPVRFLPGKEASGFPVRSDMSLTIRPWGQENDDFCMVIDDNGTSVPCPMDCLVIDLAHPLGFAAGMIWLRQVDDGRWWGPHESGLVGGWMAGVATDEWRLALATAIAKAVDAENVKEALDHLASHDQESTVVEAEE